MLAPVSRNEGLSALPVCQSSKKLGGGGGIRRNQRNGLRNEGAGRFPAYLTPATGFTNDEEWYGLNTSEFLNSSKRYHGATDLLTNRREISTDKFRCLRDARFRGTYRHLVRCGTR